MPRTTTITEAAVAAAASAIAKDGGKPTLAAVRQKLGGGSYTTIAPMLDAWRNDLDAQREASWWLQATIRSAQKELAGKIEELQEKNIDLKIENDRLKSEINALKLRLGWQV